MGTVSRFRVFNIHSGDHIAVIQMDDDLLAPEVGILDHNTKTLRPIKNGGVYTLLPIEDHTVATLKRVRDVYNAVTQTPAKLFTTHLNRIDDLIITIGNLFSEVEYLLVENVEDMSHIINPPRNPDFEHKRVTYTVLGDLLKDAIQKTHVCGPECTHEE